MNSDNNQWDAIIPRVSDKVPEGFETVNEIAAKQGISECHTGRILRKAEASGLVESAYFRLPAHKSPILHFRPKPYGKKRKS
jgi:hypothetical protein